MKSVATPVNKPWNTGTVAARIGNSPWGTEYCRASPMSEVIVFDRELNANERTRVSTYTLSEMVIRSIRQHL